MRKGARDRREVTRTEGARKPNASGLPRDLAATSRLARVDPADAPEMPFGQCSGPGGDEWVLVEAGVGPADLGVRAVDDEARPALSSAGQLR